MGGSWDATNVADGAVAVVLPDRRRPRAATSATTSPRSRSRRPGSSRRARRRSSPSRRPTSPTVLIDPRRPRSAPPSPARAWSSASCRGCPRSAGRCSPCRACAARYDDVFLPLYGAHQAQNAAVALAAVEAFAGDEPLDEDLVRAAFAEVTSPGRLEIIRRSPTILLDAAHNPHGAEATAAALEDSFTLRPAHRRPRRDGRQGRRGPAGRARAAPRPRRGHPELHRPLAARPRSWARPRSTSSARTGSPSRPDCRTRSTWPPRWPRPARRSATRSAPAASWSPAPWSPWARPARCSRAGTSDRTGRREPRADRPRPRAAEVAAPRDVRGGALTLEVDHPRPHHPGDDHHRRRPARHRAGHRARPRRRLPGGRRDAPQARGPTPSAGRSRSAAVALGFLVPMMFFLGGLFALLWGSADGLGRKIERERAAAFAAYDNAQG